jgi:hypothetical protein
MADRQLRDIVVGLVEKARAGLVNWKELDTGGTDGDYIVYFPASALNVFKVDAEIRFIALNEDGTSIGRVTSSDLELAPLLRELHGLAARSVLKVDSTLADISRALSSPGEVGTTGGA